MRSFNLLLLLCPAVIFAGEVNGSLETIGEITIVNLWGTWEEMGTAHGYLLGPDLMDLYEGYFLELAGGQTNIDILRAGYDSYFTVPEEFSAYASGIIAGVADTVSLWSPVYGRNLDNLDIFITSSVPDLSAMVDFRQIHCSSASSWGEATSGDPSLQGAPAVSRNLDYYVDQNESILEKSFLFVHSPSQGQDYLSVSFPGFMGILSGMNESGVNATLNMGNYSGTSQTSPSFVPICMALALGLTREDFDGNGTHDIEDLKGAATFWNRSNTYDIHITCPGDLSAGGDPAVVAEVNNHQGFAFRYSQDEPAIAPSNLLLTNHHRVLYPPVYCQRYGRMLDSLDAEPNVTLERLWNFMEAVGEAPVPGLGGTLQTMIFIPDERRTGLAFASPGMASCDKEPQWIDWNDVFPNHDPQGTGSTGEGSVRLLPVRNPVYSLLEVSARVDSPEDIDVFDLSGRKLDITFIYMQDNMFRADVSRLPSSVYLLRATKGQMVEWAEVVVLQ